MSDFIADIAIEEVRWSIRRWLDRAEYFGQIWLQRAVAFSLSLSPLLTCEVQSKFYAGKKTSPVTKQRKDNI